MAVRGRTPKPSAVKKLAGNPSGRLLNENEPQPNGCVPLTPGTAIRATAYDEGGVVGRWQIEQHGW